MEETVIVFIIVFIALGFCMAKCTSDDHSKDYGGGVRSICIHGLEYLQQGSGKPTLLKDEYNNISYCNY